MRIVAFVLALGGILFAQQPPANYDEARVPAYTLPPLLVMHDGTAVRSAAQWPARRAEILSLLESQMFGKVPVFPMPAPRVSVVTDPPALDGRAVRKRITLIAGGRELQVLLYLPAQVKRPVPVFVGLGFSPNQSVSADPGVPLAGTWTQDPATGAITLVPATEASRGTAASRWQLDMVLARGYGLATVYYGDIEPDFDGALAHGVRAAALRPGQQTPAQDEWGAIAAWAWGLSRVADYLVSDPDVDASRLAVVGHSRLGKTALWAAARDIRFGLVISNDSGEGGAAISRRQFGETVADLNTRFPHWFCGNYQQYNRREAAMPFDAHMLLALIAPRPLYVASAEDDRWADPTGEFLGALGASAVYERLGQPGLGTTVMPPVNTPVGGTVRYHVRTGGHDITAYDWQQYLAFADAMWPRPAR
jgi:hypothetical protein